MAITLAPLPVAAHHSFVAFDLEKEAFVRGTVAEYQFRNPHTYEWQHSPHITRLPHSCDPESALGYLAEDE